MSMKSLESAVLAELRQVAGKPTIRMKDIQEWSTGDVKVGPEEKHFYLPELQINVAVLASAVEKKTKRARP